MLKNAEAGLYQAIGKFSTTARYNSSYSSTTEHPPQCIAFLCSSREFTWFVESWDVNRPNGNLVIENKKIYPAKVVGLNLAIPLLSQTGTFAWREGLIEDYRPGFGQYIAPDIERPVLRQFIPQTDVLGTGSNPAFFSSYTQGFSRQLGRLMSMAFYVEPGIAAKYDASTSKKKKKSLNSQDYEQMPTYPNYELFNGNPNGY